MDKKYNNVLLTGFRATGKTLVGSLAAKQLNYRFIDTDLVLCERHGMSVADFVAQNGWQAFRKVEEALLRELAAEERTVVSVGGGAIEHVEAWRELRKTHFVVWLRAAAETIISRMNGDEKSGEQRPSLTGKDPDREVVELLERRTPLYRAGADLIVDTDNSTPEALAGIIVEAVSRQPTACGLAE